MSTLVRPWLEWIGCFLDAPDGKKTIRNLMDDPPFVPDMLLVASTMPRKARKSKESTYETTDTMQ